MATVLIIDDNEDDREAFRRMLTRSSTAYDVIEAASGDEGVLLFRELLPDCILLDYSLPGRNGVVYVAEMAPDGATFARLFVHEEHDGRVDITTAEKGGLYTDRDNAERYLRLEQGFRVEGEIGKPDFRTMRFATNDVRLPDPSSDPDRALEKRADTPALWASRRPWVLSPSAASTVAAVSIVETTERML